MGFISWQECPQEQLPTEACPRMVQGLFCLGGVDRLPGTAQGNGVPAWGEGTEVTGAGLRWGNRGRVVAAQPG